MNVIRCFSFRGRVISFSLSPLEDVYDVRVPRLQIIKSRPNEKEKPGEIYAPHPAQLASLEADRRMLRREIMEFWQGLSEHIDKLEGNFVSEHPSLYHKTLPRLPSADDQYDAFDGDGLATPKGQPSSLPALPPNTPASPKTESAFSFPHERIDTHTEGSQMSNSGSAPSTLSSTSTASTSTSGQDSLQLLNNLRHKFQRTEQDLYAELSRTPDSSLNNVRRSFLSSARGAAKRLSAWENKHAHTEPGSTATATSDFVAGAEPEWWKSGCHAVPGGNVIVREDDWGSIIAFTLSSTDYQKELVNMSLNKSFAPTSPPPTPALGRPSFFIKNASTKWFGPTPSTPDPDQEGVLWYEPETYSAVITRREHPRDPTSLLKLGIPEVLRPKAVTEAGLPGPSKFATIGLSSGKGFAGGAPPLAWAKPDVQLSKEEADGLLSATGVEKVDRVLQELEAASENTGSGSVRTSTSDHRDRLSASGFVETNIKRGKASSILSSIDSDAAGGEGLPPTPPPKDSRAGKEVQRSRDGSAERTDSAQTAPPTPSGTSGFASTLSSALRYMLRTEPPPTPVKYHHGLLSATASPAIDDKPHIKYDWTIGKRLKFSCTVYYAKQFDTLRRRCGIEDAFLHSLARCENWAAEGGKSRSNFWRTTDNQFIVKTLVNAWNVADLHVLIELGPSYFRYMDATTSKPTVLAKLLGFYTVEIKNLETGATQAKADLLVMENLFYNQSIVKTFDLKGIQGRKVKPSNNVSGSKTLFDGEWIEGQQRTLTIVRPYSKVVLQDAIKADCEFLMKSNIMDYSYVLFAFSGILSLMSAGRSLLVGIDESKKQLVCGLVDTIGSYTFAKTLEYKAKQGLNSGKEVTVMPPNEYQERFVNAMDNYFVACPGSSIFEHTELF
ncbi:hypothetical protein EIP86_010400 [Pleurotus ostreatoroseus]|nr:hypothetical protein EIP86_010400 [Pleurotus ostreatoroseus]